jgi:hypothetical protein
MGREFMTALGQVFMDPHIITVFSANVMAILRCTQFLLTKTFMRKRVHISDSRAALATLVKTTTSSSLVWECMHVLERLSELNKVTSVHIRATRDTDQ